MEQLYNNVTTQGGMAEDIVPPVYGKSLESKYDSSFTELLGCMVNQLMSVQGNASHIPAQLFSHMGASTSELLQEV